MLPGIHAEERQIYCCELHRAQAQTAPKEQHKVRNQGAHSRIEHLLCCALLLYKGSIQIPQDCC